MLARAFSSFAVGLSRRWRTGVIQAFGIIGAVWLLTEIALATSAAARSAMATHGGDYVAFVCTAGALWFLGHVYERRSASFRVPTTSSRITLKFGDLFDEHCDLLIAVNEFFDAAVGHIVAQNSVHGQFIGRFYGGDEARFRADVDDALAGANVTTTNRPHQPTGKYEIGTTAVVEIPPHKAFLVAMSHTDMETAKASTTVPMLWEALRGGLRTIHNHGNGNRFAMPLIGNGRSSVNIEPQHLLRLIVLSLVDFGRKTGLPNEVTIVVPEACFESLDIREIAGDWKRR